MRNMKEYVGNMKEYVENMKEYYEEISGNTPYCSESRMF